MSIEAMRKRQNNNAVIGDRAAREILHVGLKDSTFQEKYPEAYLDLLKHRDDLAGSIEKVLNRSRLV